MNFICNLFFRWKRQQLSKKYTKLQLEVTHYMNPMQKSKRYTKMKLIAAYRGTLTDIIKFR